MRLSIIVSVLNSHEFVRRQLQYLKNVLDEDCELVLIDDGSEPPIEGATICTNDKRPWTQPAARNIGAKEAKGDILLFFDIDHILTKEAIEEAKALEPFTRMRWRRLAGTLDERGNLVVVNKDDVSIHPNTFAIHKDDFERTGGYDEKFCGSYGGDDVEFHKRAKDMGIEAVEGNAAIYCANHTDDGNKDMFHALDRIFVYSAILGGKDDIHEPEWMDPNYIMYTDNQQTKSQKWDIQLVGSRSGKIDNYARAAKIFKFHPELYCIGDIRVWCDGNVVLTPAMSELIEREMQETDLLFFSHYRRDCIYDEAKIAKSLKLDSPKVIDEQMQRYRDEGFPEHFGLPECNVIVSRNTPEVRAFFGLWEKEVERGSVRDQLSVSYALWKTSPRYKISDADVEKHQRAFKYRKCYAHNAVQIEVNDRRELFVMLTALHGIDPHWLIARDRLRGHLSQRFEVQHVYASDSAYLHKMYNTMCGAPLHGGVDTKPFDTFPMLKHYSWMFFFENDMIITPEQVDQLLSHDVDVVSGMYAHQDGHRLTHHYMPGTYEPDEIPQTDKLIEVKSLPQGGLLMKRGVMEKIQYPWHGPVIIQQRDSDGNVTMVDFTGQDVALSHNLRANGVKLYLDPTVRYIHRKVMDVKVGMFEHEYNEALKDVAAKYPRFAKKILQLRKPE